MTCLTIALGTLVVAIAALVVYDMLKHKQIEITSVPRDKMYCPNCYTGEPDGIVRGAEGQPVATCHSCNFTWNLS